MATRDEILKRIETKLRKVKQDELTWSDVVTAIGGSGQTNKSLIVNAIKNKNGNELADLIFGLVNDKITSDAEAEAASMMTDDNLTLTELQRIF